MDFSIAIDRLSKVARADSITTSQADFLSTHVSLKRLQLLTKFELQPTSATEATEEDVFEQIIMNPNNHHQFVVVYGQSGTGKSHLIRWFEARFRQEKPSNEVCLFIRRSDNTLKGTIRQLLKAPEVKNIANKDVFDRLARAAGNEDAAHLKGSIYHAFINEVENDEGALSIVLSSVKRKRLAAFLSSEAIRTKMMAPDGPIERIYSKIDEGRSLVDRDTIAQFLPEDFTVSNDLADELDGYADNNARKMARALMADEDGPELSKELARYLNQFVNDVIQRSAGIEAGDFRQLFQDIRRELFKIGKNLTIFIEDVTSFTGVDDALLDALIVEHTGMNQEDGICRISSIVGTTSNYLQNNFRDNHKDRITKFIHIPSDVFDTEQLLEFVGRYLNTMSLKEETIERWAFGRGESGDYPVHTPREGVGWDTVEIDGGKRLCLYPFTRNSIEFLYNNSLAQGHQTPRYIIRDIIEPAVREVLMNKSSFPSRRFQIGIASQALSYQVSQQVSNAEESARLLRFLNIWGNGKPEQYEDAGHTYVSGLDRKLLDDLDLPAISFSTSAAPSASPSGVLTSNGASVFKAKKPSEMRESKPTNRVSTPVVDHNIAAANIILNNWVSGEIIDYSSYGGASGVLNNAMKDLNDFLVSAIDWQAKGISHDFVSKVGESSTRFVALQNQSKGSGFFALPASTESLCVISAMIRWNRLGSKSWRYSGSDFDIYLLTCWVEAHEDEIVASVVEKMPCSTYSSPGYIDAAIASEAIKKILYGENAGSLSKVDLDWLLKPAESSQIGQGHSNKWKSLAMVCCDSDRNRETIRQFFNLVQGSGGSSMVVLNRLAADKAVERVVTNHLIVPMEQLDACGFIKKPFSDIIEGYRKVESRLNETAQAEIDQASTSRKSLIEAFDDEEVDDGLIIDFVEACKRYFNEINLAQINVNIPDTNNVRREALKISKAVKSIDKVLSKNDPIDILIGFSNDPIHKIAPLSQLVNQVWKLIESTDKRLATLQAGFSQSEGAPMKPEERYAEALTAAVAFRDAISEEDSE